MLKTVDTDEVKIGMFIQELKGPWLDHPFWKKAFLLEDTKDLEKLRQSKIEKVIIDISKGADINVVPDIKIAAAVENVAEKIQVDDVNPIKNSSTPVKRVTLKQERVKANRAIQDSKKAVASMFKEVRMGKAISVESALPLVENIAASVARNESALISLARLKTKDDYTYMHSVAVCALMIALARELNLSDTEVNQAGLAGLLHDLGKAAIPIEVLNKPGALTNEEFDLVKMHPTRGHGMLIESNFEDNIALDVCLHHHEKMDGTGYPDKLSGKEISLFARMGAVCDVYDAVTSNRPYKSGWEPGVSLKRMASWTGHFDEEVFKAFVKAVGIYPVGSMVMLSSERLAVVIDQSPVSLLTPIVKVFFSTRHKTRIPLEIVDLSKSNAKDKIVGHEDPILWGIDDVNDLWSSE